MREVLKPVPERRGFQHLPKSPADVNVSENHVCLLLLHKTVFSLKNFSVNAFFLYLYWKRRFQGEWCLHSEVMKLRLLLCMFLMMTLFFLMGPGMLIRKTMQPCINGMQIDLLIHGFLPAKTWLLISCDTAFYAIMYIYNWSQQFKNCLGVTTFKQCETLSFLLQKAEILSWFFVCIFWVFMENGATCVSWES